MGENSLSCRVLQAKFSAAVSPGSHLAIDETIERFTGRSTDITTTPGKPTPTGLKMWILALEGYLLGHEQQEFATMPVHSRCYIPRSTSSIPLRSPP